VVWVGGGGCCGKGGLVNTVPVSFVRCTVDRNGRGGVAQPADSTAAVWCSEDLAALREKCYGVQLCCQDKRPPLLQQAVQGPWIIM
jgi:hypothetical protein